MGKGIIGTLGLLGTLVFAIPVAMLGVDFLASGQSTLGLAFVAVAVLMVAVEEYITTPTDIPGAIAARTVDRVIEPPEESLDDETTVDGPDATEQMASEEPVSENPDD